MTLPAPCHRWEIAVRALELEDEIVGQLARGFHRIPETDVRDAYADAWERACRPIGQLGAFPEDDLRGLPGWLHRSTAQRLMHVARDTARWRADNPAALEQRPAAEGDPAAIVVQREKLARVVAELDLEPAEVRAYFVADRVDGARRHEIRARTGWSQDKVKHLRKRMAAALERAAVGVVPPLAVGRAMADAMSRAKAAVYGLIGYAPAAEGALGGGSNAIIGARVVATGCAAVIIGGSGFCAQTGLLSIGQHPSRASAHVQAAGDAAPAATFARRPRSTTRPAAARLVTTAPQATVTSVPSQRPTARRRQRLGIPKPARESVPAHASATADDFAAATFEAPAPATAPAPSALRATTAAPTASSTQQAHGRAGDFAAAGFETGP
jgi:DNA-directed RNA polymerase specialized sigma24 family protein